MLLSPLKQVLSLYFMSVISTIIAKLVLKIQTKASTSQIFLADIIFENAFLHSFVCVNVAQFS